MRVSEPILPLRIYDDLFDQQRFDKLLPEGSKPTLIYPNNDLPSFQISRPVSFSVPEVFYLRNVCDDYDVNFKKQIPDAATTFNEPVANDFYTNYHPNVSIKRPAGAPQNYKYTKIDCGQLVLNPLPSGFEYNDAVAQTPNFSFPINSSVEKFRFKIVVERISPGMQIQIYNDFSAGNLILSITATGSYTVEFDSQASKVEVYFLAVPNSDFAISYMQCQNIDYSNDSHLGVILDESLISVNVSQEEVLTFCSKAPVSIRPGIYYYVIITDDSQTYFSETFEIRTIKEMETFTKIKWFNSCDINSVIIYNPEILMCNFYHTFYFNNLIEDPKYNTTEEPTQNGEEDEIADFKRWQKTIAFIIYKSPAFLTDALTAIFIHDNISIRPPLNTHQDAVQSELQIIKLTSEVADVDNGFYQSVNLKLTVFDRFTITACCN